MKRLFATLSFAALSLAATALSARAADFIIDPPPHGPIMRLQPVVRVEPVYRTVQERVWVPAEYETRWIELDGRLVQARILIHDGYYAYVERLVCISPGHWSPQPYPVPYEPPVVIYRNPPTVVPEGYAPGHDSSEHGTFSPTYEWPK